MELRGCFLLHRGIVRQGRRNEEVDLKSSSDDAAKLNASQRANSSFYLSYMPLNQRSLFNLTQEIYLFSQQIQLSLRHSIATIHALSSFQHSSTPLQSIKLLSSLQTRLAILQLLDQCLRKKRNKQNKKK